MAEKELNLLQFPAIDMAEFCACWPKIVWSEMVQLHPLSAPSDHLPNDILGDPLTPRRPMAAHRAKYSARRPMSLPDLQILNSKSRELDLARSAAYEHRSHCEIADTAQIVSVGFLQ
jgi:hypothetical protein